MKITVIGSHLCPDTLYALNLLAAAGVEAGFQDILSCHAALQTFLNIRETSELYAEICGTQRLGVTEPAMSITGSGAHGIIATMPLYAACQVNGYSEESLLRAAALSRLVCMYIKEYSGKLSALCGCAMKAMAAVDAA